MRKKQEGKVHLDFLIAKATGYGTGRYDNKERGYLVTGFFTYFGNNKKPTYWKKPDISTMRSNLKEGCDAFIADVRGLVELYKRNYGEDNINYNVRTINKEYDMGTTIEEVSKKDKPLIKLIEEKIRKIKRKADKDRKNKYLGEGWVSDLTIEKLLQLTEKEMNYIHNGVNSSGLTRVEKIRKGNIGLHYGLVKAMGGAVY